MGEIPNLIKLGQPRTRTLPDNPVKSYILRRVLRQNKNFMMAVVGETGSGKSYAAIKLAMQLDPTFNIDRVCYTAQEFMALINSNLPPGSVIVFDEIGVSMDSRTWYSLMNKLINYVLQTFRHKNLIVIFTVPLTKFIDSKMRALLHAYIVMKAIGRSEKASYGSLYMMQVNYHTGEIFTKKPRILHGRERIRIDYIRFQLPPKKFLDEYETKRCAFTSKLNMDVEEELADAANKARILSNKEILNDIMQNNKDYYLMMKKGEPHISTERIAAKWNIGKSRAAFVKDMAETMLGWRGGEKPVSDEAKSAPSGVVPDEYTVGDPEPERPETLPGDSGSSPFKGSGRRKKWIEVPDEPSEG